MSGWKPKPNQYTSAVYTKPKGQDPRTKIPIRRPLPGIVILVHGVNDIGEAYPTQAGGICDGLNLRLGRADLTPGDWDVERSCPTMRKATYERRHAAQGYNPIIPFYWGYRPVDKDTYDTDQARYQDELRKRGPANAEAPYDAYWLEGASQASRGFQNTDCFENWLNEAFARGGGVFANATTNLVDMWGPGGDLFWLVRQLSKADDDLSHAIYKNPNRIYIVNAARRLANLILMIRRDSPKTKDDTINIVAHSQGTLVSMLANFMVATDPLGAERPADCLILNHSPYSLETPVLEQMQSDWGQQTIKARTDTLLNFCSLMDIHKATAPDTSTLAADGILSPTVAGKPEYTRDNHGKVFNYFCLQDGVVSLLNVQGIGWQGVSTSVSDKAGPAFAQRVFVDGRAMHAPPGPYTLPKIDMPAVNRAVPAGEVRNINAPQLPDLGFVFRLPGGCELLGASDWGVDSAALAETGRNTVTEMLDNPLPDKIDRYFPPMLTDDKKGPLLSPSEVAEVQQAFQAQGKDWTLIEARQPEMKRLKITRYMTRKELLDKARNTHTNISNHSAIVLNRDVSRCVTAFDLAIGQCMSFDTTTVDGGGFWQKLLRLADWRDSDAVGDKPYYTQGVLPREIKLSMNKPPVIPGIVNETIPVATFSERRGETRMVQTAWTQTDTKST